MGAGRGGALLKNRGAGWWIVGQRPWRPCSCFRTACRHSALDQIDARDCRGRREARERAIAHLQAGNLQAAEECFQRSVDITPRMAKQLIEVWTCPILDGPALGQDASGLVAGS